MMQESNVNNLDYDITEDKRNGSKTAFIPNIYKFDSAKEIADHIEKHSFAQMACNGANCPSITSLPLVCSETDATGLPSKLIGHIAKRNPQTKELKSGKHVRLTFCGSSTYVSPRWFRDKKTVPTWNYLSVEVEGILKITEQPSDIVRILEHSIEFFERKTSNNCKLGSLPWRLSSADKDLVNSLLTGIVGLEIDVTNIAGIKRLNQEKSRNDRLHIISGLKELSLHEASSIAELMMIAGNGL